MNPLSEIGRRYKWLRHGRGYGVHSPWAYRIITGILSEKACYYSYRSINRTFGTRAEAARALFRLMVHHQPGRVDVLGDASWSELRERACPGGKGSAMLVVEDARRFAGTDGYGIIVFVALREKASRELWEKILGERKAGIAIDTHNGMGIVSLRADQPAQLIDAYVKLP